jgi:hypothetical protein
MNMLSKVIIFSVFPLYFATGLCLSGELIPPTRTLEAPEAAWGRLTVFSEPPELDVLLDSTKMGQTPLWLEKVKPGFHSLQINDSKTDIYVKEGETLKLGLFKGSFITLPEKEKEITPVPPVEPKRSPEKPKTAQPTEKMKDLTIWALFPNGEGP